MKYGLLTAALLLVLVTGDILAQKKPVVWSFPEVKIKVDQRMPDFTLPTIDGGELSLRKYRGRKVVLHIFASW